MIEQEDGPPLIQGTLVDITQLKLAEEALRESEARFKALFEHAGDAILTIDTKGRFTDVNEESVNRYGYTRRELLTMGPDDLAPSEEAAKLIEESIDRGGGTFETTHRRKDGSLVPTEARTRLIVIGGEGSVMCACRDTTERKRSEKEIKKRNQELTALNSISSKIMQGSLNLDEVLQQISDGILEVFDCTTALIFLLDEKEGVVKWAALSTKEKIIERINAIVGSPLVQIELPARADFNEAVSNALDGRMTVKHDLYELASPLLSKRVCSALQKLAGSKTFLSMPLMAKGRTLGGIFASRREEIDEKDKETMMTFANQAAAVIEHARLDQSVHEELTGRIQAEKEREQSFERLRRTLDGTVYALASTVEMKDAYTAGHQRRVARLACAIAKEAGLSEEQIEGLRIAGLIHDIGKINVPAEILSKSTHLTDLEFGLIQAHPQTAYNILKEIDFPWPVAEIVLQHHERLNGSGYPNALKGEEILLEARILAVADVVEAMSSRRPYREALGVNKALEEVEKNKGVLYDPRVVDACLRLFAEGFDLEEGTN